MAKGVSLSDLNTVIGGDAAPVVESMFETPVFSMPASHNVQAARFGTAGTSTTVAAVAVRIPKLGMTVKTAIYQRRNVGSTKDTRDVGKPSGKVVELDASGWLEFDTAIRKAFLDWALRDTAIKAASKALDNGITGTRKNGDIDI